MISGYNLHFTCAQNDHTVNLIVIQRLQSVPNYWESVPNYWEGTWSEHVYWVSIVKVVTAFLRTYRKRKVSHTSALPLQQLNGPLMWTTSKVVWENAKVGQQEESYHKYLFWRRTLFILVEVIHVHGQEWKIYWIRR